MSEGISVGTQELAQSLYSLVARIGQKQQQDAENLAEPIPVPDWAGLAWDKQAPWLTLASRAPKRMESLEGRPLVEVAFEMFKLTCNYEEAEQAQQVWDQFMPANLKLMWQAVTRHIFTIMDCDELSSPGESEQMWYDWFIARADQQPRILLPEGVSR